MLTVKTRFVVPPTVRFALKALSTVGVAALTVTHAPVLEVPLVALFDTEAVMLVVAVKFVVPLVLLADGQVAAVGVVVVVTGTVIVQVVGAPAPPALMMKLEIWIVRVPEVRVAVPAVQFALVVTVEPLVVNPVGNTSVKL